MTKHFFTVTVEEVTAANIEQAMKMLTGRDGWVKDENDLQKQIHEGHIWPFGNNVVVFEDDVISRW